MGGILIPKVGGPTGLIKKKGRQMVKNGIYAFVLISLISGAVYAQQEEMVSIAKSKLTQNQLQELQTSTTVQTVGQWIGLGKEVGTAVNDSLRALSDQADHFAHTRVGNFTMWMVAFKILGYPVVHFALGGFLFLFGLPIWLWSFRKNCIPFRYLQKEEGNVKTYAMYRPPNNEYGEWQWCHALVLALYIGLCLLVTLT